MPDAGSILEDATSTPLFSEIGEHADDCADASTRHDRLALSVLARASATIDGHLLVVGARQGHVALALGAAARTSGRGRVFAIDVFPDDGDTPDAAGWSLDGLLRRAAEAQLGPWVLPHYGTAATFARLMPTDFHCRLIHLEAAHGCTHLDTDIFLLEPLLVPGGWLTVGREFLDSPGARHALGVFAHQRPGINGWRVFSSGLLVAQKQL